MIVNVPSMQYLIENIEDEEVQLFIISLGTIWRDSFDIEVTEKEEKMTLFLELMSEGVCN